MIIANPNCSTAQMVVALKPLHDRARIRRVVVTTLQSVSGAGKEGIDELWDQTKGIYVHGQEVAPKKFQRQIAFNVIPQIGSFLDDGSTQEEWKMVAETKKILDKSIKVTATCVRVPVFVGHSEAVNIEFEDFLDEHEARDILREARQFGDSIDKLREFRILAAQQVVDLFLEEEAQSLTMLSDFIGKRISMQVESLYHQEQYDIVLV